MNDETQERFIIAAFVIAIIALLWHFLKGTVAVKNIVKYVQDTGFQFPALNIPVLERAEIFTPQSRNIGNVFDGPVGGESCCQPIQCPTRIFNISIPPPTITAPAINVVPSDVQLAMPPPVQTFEAPQSKPVELCFFTPEGYLKANPDVEQAWINQARGVRKIKKEYGLRNAKDWANYHYSEWGRNEGRSIGCDKATPGALREAERLASTGGSGGAARDAGTARFTGRGLFR